MTSKIEELEALLVEVRAEFRESLASHADKVQELRGQLDDITGRLTTLEGDEHG